MNEQQAQALVNALTDIAKSSEEHQRDFGTTTQTASQQAELDVSISLNNPIAEG